MQDATAQGDCDGRRSVADVEFLEEVFDMRLDCIGTHAQMIGDLLGHQDPMTTSLYTDVTVSEMRMLVQPWPLIFACTAGMGCPQRMVLRVRNFVIFRLEGYIQLFPEDRKTALFPAPGNAPGDK